jgi:hypothetical protein
MGEGAKRNGESEKGKEKRKEMVENPLLRLGGASKVRKAEKRESEKEGSAGGLARAREGERACLALPLAHQPSCPERKNLPGDHSWRLGR